jgi:hypothetical protein
MTAIRSLPALHGQLYRLEETRRLLTARLHRTVNALALTLDAQAGTRERIDEAMPWGSADDVGPGDIVQRQGDLERYRAVLDLLATDSEHSTS